MGEFVSSGSRDAKNVGNIRYVHHQGNFFQRVILFLLHLVFFLPFGESKLVCEWPKRITQSKFFILFFSRRHGGWTRRLRNVDLHGCAVSLQNRTRRHDVPHAAEQMAAPMCVSGLCHSSTVNSPLAGGIGVRVLPASCVLVPKRDACAFLVPQEKPKTQPASHATASYIAENLGSLHFGFRSRYISRYENLKFRFLPFVVVTIVAMVFFFAVFAARAPAMGNSADRAWQLSQLMEGVSTAFNPSHSSLSYMQAGHCVSKQIGRHDAACQGCPRCVSRSPEARCFRVVARAVRVSQPAVLSALLVIQLFGIMIPPPYFP